MKKHISLSVFFMIITMIVRSQTSLVSFGSTWKYFDNGTSPGSTWTSNSFNDASWNSGAAEFGYGDTDEATVVNIGDATGNYITTYFRKTIAIANNSQYNAFTVDCRIDDGIVVYINGTEAGRYNMPSGTITNTTLASTSIENTSTNFIINSNLFITGNNTIAVEVHQVSASSSDISFDLKLSATTGTITNPSLLRGPYLQAVSNNQAVIRWRTSATETGQVKYGTSPTNLNQTAIESAATKNHSVKLSGLNPQTKYYYSIGNSSGNTLLGDATTFVITQPNTGTTNKYRMWVLGDCGTGYQEQKDVRDQYQNYLGSGTTDAVLLLGDNAYFDGSDSVYQVNFFDVYKDQFKNSPLYPAPGNHEYYTVTGDHNIQNITNPYFDIFTTPKQGECGGVASNSRGYYSYNVGNVHFLSLDSHGKESDSDWRRLYDTTGPQAMWVKQDLLANTLPWVVVYWHHPPYTMGTYDSDADVSLTKIRERFLKMLEQYNVDLIMCGHSHVYERSKLMLGHYGTESTFNPNVHHLSSSSGLYDGSTNSCMYVKNNNSKGIIYSVAGSAGKVGNIPGTSWPHAAMQYSNKSEHGSLVLEVEDNKLEGKWICEDGVIRDKFTIMKNVNNVFRDTIYAGNSVNLSASWPGNYDWGHSTATSKTVSVSPITNTTYVVNDQYTCIADTFHVYVIQSTGVASTTNQINTCSVNYNDNILSILPNFENKTNTHIAVYDIAGKIVYEKNQLLHENKIEINTKFFSSGVYIVKVSNELITEAMKFTKQ